MSTGARPRVLVTHPVLDPATAFLEEVADLVTLPDGLELTQDALRRAAEGCAGIVCQVMDPIGDTVLSTPGLRCVSNVGVGFDNIDVAAATARRVMVTNTPGILDETTADFAFALLMAAARRVAEADGYVRGGHFRAWAIDLMLGVDVSNATLGLVGLGRIGRAMARRARGFNMRVLYNKRTPLDADTEREMGVHRADLGTLLAESDFVSIHVPLTDMTRHMIGAAEFAQMRPTAVLVNTSRGPVVDEAALVEALTQRRIFAAGLDVYEREPAVHPGLLSLRNAVLAPHIGSGSIRTRSEMCAVAARNMATAMRGGRPPNLVNPTGTVN